METIKIVGFDPAFTHHYVELNREWIESHFWIESMDIAQLENPGPSILEDGGEIFFVLEGERVVGTCAMVAHGLDCFELAKMAVAPSARGKGYGDLLMTTAISWARSKGAEKIMLLSNTVLEPAIALYRKHGFENVRLGEHPYYKRCNIEMELHLR